MTKQVLVYEKVIPVTKQRHGGWSVRTGSDYAFAQKINFVPLTAVEFLNAATEYTIVFVGKDHGITPAAILGLHKEENLYVSPDGHWNAKYVPAFIKRYPFVFAPSQDGTTFTLCIDESFSGCNTEGRGERLFDSDGERTQYLESVLGFLRAFEIHFSRTRAFCARLKELDLLEPMQATYSVPGGHKGAVTGFMAINRDKLKAVPAEKLVEMVKTDELELAYLQLYSMRNFTKVLERSAGAEGATAAGASAVAAVPAEAAEPEGTDGPSKEGKSIH